MTINDLSELEILRGIFTLIFVIISLFIGFRILIKSFSLKRTNLITVGLTLILINSAWWCGAFNLVSIILFNYAFEPVFYLFLMNAFIPIALICWIYTFCTFYTPKFKKKIFIPYFLICVVYEIILLYFLFTDYTFIASYEGIFSYKRTLFNISFLVFAILTTLITGVIFGITSIKSEKIRVHYKGYFILLAFLTFVLGAIMDTFSFGNIVLQIIIRLILISSSIEYYFGFFLPDWFIERMEMKKNN